MHGHAVALGIVIGDRGVHLHLVLADLGAIVGALAHQIGVGEGRIDIAKLEKNIALDIVRPVLMQIDGIGRHRRPRGVIGRQLADFQLDALERFLGGRVVDRGDGSDRLAAITHTLARQRMFGARNRQNAEGLVAIGAGDDRLHARQLRSLRYVDVEDFGMRIGAAEDAPGKHSRRDKIGGVFGASGNLFRPVDHRHVVADRMRRHDLVHGEVPAACRSAAYFTASMIFT